MRYSLVLLTCAALVAVGCATAEPAEPESSSSLQSAPGAAVGEPSEPPEVATDMPTVSDDDTSSGSVAPTEGDVPSDPGAPSAPAASPTGSAEPLVITAALSTACVRRGEQLVLTVETQPWASVAFLAHYAGGDNGADPPWGQGHGGNDGGIVNETGRYEATWIVAMSAPIGPGHVEVTGGYGEQLGEATVPFEVVEAVGGTC